MIDNKTRGNARYSAYSDNGSIVGYGETRDVAIRDLEMKLLARRAR